MSGITANGKVLVIEDDGVFNRLIVKHLERMGLSGIGAENWQQAERYLDDNEPDLTLLDVQLPDAQGLELLAHLVPISPVIVLTAFGSVEQAVEAIRCGAAEYLMKPVNLDELEIMVQRALDRAHLQRDVRFYKSRTKRMTRPFMVGTSALFKDMLHLIDAVAPVDTTVLIQGESGVGKELVAREIHDRSARADRNFVPLDCCTLQENLFESELFGHERGSFTGADRQKKGMIEVAEGGTLFLDEIGEISAAIQAKLLRVIETGQFRRLGGTKDLSANVRIIAATNRDLEAMSAEGTFRSDLYYRLGAFVILTPPLRDRREDIPELVDTFISHHNFSRPIDKVMGTESMTRLVDYDWPGNVRELRNVIERSIILSGNEPEIGPEHLGLPNHQGRDRGAAKTPFEAEPTLDELKRDYLAYLIAKHRGHRTTVARVLGVSERNLYRMLGKYRLK